MTINTDYTGMEGTAKIIAASVKQFQANSVNEDLKLQDVLP